MEQQLQEQQLRAIGEQLHDFPDLQQHYQSLLLNEQLQRQQRAGSMTGTAGLNGVAGLSGANQQPLSTALLRDQTSLRVQREQANLRAYEELLLRQQQQQRRLQQQQQHMSSGSFHEEMSPSPQDQSPASMLFTALSAQQQQQQVQQQQQQQDGLQPYSSPQELLSQNIAAAGVLSSSSPTAPAPLTAAVSQNGPGVAEMDDHLRSFSLEGSERSTTSDKRSFKEPKGSSSGTKKKKKRKYTRKNGSKAAFKKNGAAVRPEEQDNPGYQRDASPLSPSPSTYDDYDYDDGMTIDHSEHSGLEVFAVAADMVSQEASTKGSVEGLLQAAEDSVQLDGAAMVLTATLSEVEPWSDSESDEGGRGLKVSDKPAESIATRTFKSSVPSLPEEPIFDDDGHGGYSSSFDKGDVTTENVAANEATFPDVGLSGKASEEKSSNKQFDVAEFPHPVDTWWPSKGGVRKERKTLGETSDEDDFMENMSSRPTVFRANESKIRSRLSRAKEPGVLEKLPHCCIHRVRVNKNSSSPELVYCHQVTEIYPQEVMCCCSKCGTWRHAACGGHFEPYSARKNADTPFVAVCDFCHEEEQYLGEFSQGRHRIERQRMENIRRGLATSSVLRHSSYSKHGGTYKWPLGSVSATHIGGHTRSVHVRHDKAEKQWTDMAARLGRGYGYRQKERVRSRTKEFERLLVSIEDAESFTDRHNMLLFLLRDTSKPKPAGFENQIKNIFDPAEDGDDLDDDLEAEKDISWLPGNRPKNEETASAAASPADATGETANASSVSETCSRPGCDRRRRFDSQFCSDACGVVTLELDLLRTLQDAQDIHPSVLRH